jgi:hypothetical protein
MKRITSVRWKILNYAFSGYHSNEFRALTSCMNVSYVLDHAWASSLLFHCGVSVLWLLIMLWCGYVKCSILLYKWIICKLLTESVDRKNINFSINNWWIHYSIKSVRLLRYFSTLHVSVIHDHHQVFVNIKPYRRSLLDCVTQWIHCSSLVLWMVITQDYGVSCIQVLKFC